jgi:hypothetical protein
VFTPVKIVRVWLPALIFVVGLAMLIISPDIVGLEGAALMLGGGLGVVVSNRIHRMGLQGEKDRDDEMDARRFMEKYGVWRDEASEDVLARAERAGDIAPRAAARAAAVGDAQGATGDADATGPGAAADRTPAGEHPHAAARRPGRSAGARRSPRR